jgi:hypothetical protein
MNIKTPNNIYLALTYLIAFFLVFLNKGNGLFWDTIQLASGHGNFYYSNNFSHLLLPVELDSGHIPAFGVYIALVWKIFGRSIEISHLAMLPFVLGIVFQLTILCKRFISENYIGISVLLIFLDASLMSQITLVSPDVPLMFFFLLALNSILKNNPKLIITSIFLLFLTSMRGMMLSVCLVLLDVYVNFGYKNLMTIEKIKVLSKRSLLYLPSLLLFTSFSLYHYHVKGWIGYHEDSPWADCFERVDFKGFLINIGLLGWRILDFGRVGVWVVFIYLIIKFKSQILKDKKKYTLFFLFIILLFLLPLNMLWAKGLLMHRYLMPIYILFSLLTASILFSDYVPKKLKNAFIVIWLLIALTGNLWIYPPKISKGWDATLAHLPYYKLRSKVIKYLETNRINFKDVDTFFPNYYSLEDIDLNNDKRSFDNYTIENGSKYILYSNIFNVDDDVYDYMMTHYTSVKEFKKNGVFFMVLKKIE